MGFKLSVANDTTMSASELWALICSLDILMPLIAVFVVTVSYAENGTCRVDPS